MRYSHKQPRNFLILIIFVTMKRCNVNGSIFILFYLYAVALYLLYNVYVMCDVLVQLVKGTNICFTCECM